MTATRLTLPAPRTGRRSRLGGFSLVEIMVGILIGMFAVLVILQLLSSTSTQQRLAGSSGDAQINGAIASHLLSRELTQAGLGLSAYTLLGCSLGYTTTGDGAAVTLGALAPVTVNPATSLVPAGDANTDTLLVIGGASGSPSEGDATLAVSTSTSLTVSTPTSFAVGDWVVAAGTTRDSSSACALRLGRVTAISGSALTLTSATASLPLNSGAYNLGARPNIHAFAVRNGNLTMCDYLVNNCGSSSATSNSAVWVPIASNVVSLRAQYGRDTSGTSSTPPVMDGVVDSFDQTTPASGGTVPLYCGWLRVIGLRLALVARSQQYDKALVTTAAPTWSGATANTSTTSTLATVTPTAAPIDLSGNSEWQHYRYKTIEVSIPLRNIIWNGNQQSYQGGNVKC
ncbi:PilW family protein [Pseudacidovorax sp. NFM-22]|uniref:PilW family protein n=1 Tax=Pseudacidovorax sp. NFM-22 TaxID=2744469 RepID=UPI001F429ED8|nr:PilW family protein [Pseudacidovorax sp. NFM-22]